MKLRSARILAISIFFGSATLQASSLPKDSCFISEPVPDTVWQHMQGKSYKPNPHIGREDLCYLRVLHWDYDGKTHQGEMVCNKKIASKLVNIFRKLYEAKYPIQRMVLPDEYNADDEQSMTDNNSSCFCFRTVAGSNDLSLHALGMAVDINTLYNPYIRIKNSKKIIQPLNAETYCDRSKKFDYKIEPEDDCCKAFKKHGFLWGGDWKAYKDYQHFYKK
jgi:hypothetical protein